MNISDNSTSAKLQKNKTKTKLNEAMYTFLVTLLVLCRVPSAVS